MRESGVLTSLLNAAQSGDAAAAQSAYDLVYAELKRRARNSLRGAAPDQTLTPTALVHEVYVRFSEREAPPLRDRTHFYALAARAMRQILVDHARRRSAGKRGGGAQITDFDQALSIHRSTQRPHRSPRYAVSSPAPGSWTCPSKRPVATCQQHRWCWCTRGTLPPRSGGQYSVGSGGRKGGGDCRFG